MPRFPLVAALLLVGQSAQALTPVRIGYFHGGRTNVIYRTSVFGYFDQEGILVDLYTASLNDQSLYKVPKTHDETLKLKKKLSDEEFSKMRGTEIVDAMMKGDVEAGTIGESSFIQCVNEGKPIVAVALLGFDTIERPGHAIGMRSDLVIKSTADFSGKVLVTRRAGPGDYIFLMEFLRSIGHEGDKTIKVIPQVPDDKIAVQLKNKEVDGGYYHLMTVAGLEAAGLLRSYRALNWLNPEMSQAVLVFRKDFVVQHPDSVQKVVDAYIRRIAYEKTIPERKADRSWDKGVMMKSEFKGMMIPQYALPPSVRPELLEAMQDLLLKYGFIKSKTDLRDAIDNSFVAKGMENLKAHPIVPFKP
ncbi:MAG: ABC transporter substrate-binding protein [Elusimicrobia bacterium]|nr:ABC transporter substrate-binding protein [Elusimicrobiota bacterium]